MSKNPFRSRLATQPTGASSTSSASASTSLGDVFADPIAGSTTRIESEPATQNGEQGRSNLIQTTSPLSSSPTTIGAGSPTRLAGALNSQSSVSSPSSASGGRYAPPPGPPPPSRRTEAQTSTAALDDSMSALSIEAPPAPPAYSPAPNVWVGEASMEFGPRRAFQEAPPPLIVAVPGMVSGPPPSGPQQYQAPPQQYAAPGAQRGPYPQQSMIPPAPAPVHVQDDGKPTRTAVVGHPLMHEGRVLVYTPGYECRSCWNTGYKCRSRLCSQYAASPRLTSYLRHSARTEVSSRSQGSL